nr:PREDICTED: uncharacterized protein LOC109042277 [Bemisia tabaci]
MTKADLAWREIRGLEDSTDSADFVERYSMKVGPRYNVPLTDNALWWSICIKQCNAIFGYIFVPPPPNTRKIKTEMAYFSAGELVQVTHGDVNPEVKPRETRPGNIEFECSCPTNPEFLALAKESQRFDEKVFAMFKKGNAALVEGFLRGVFEGTKFKVMSNFEVTVKLEEWFGYHEIQLRKDLTDKEFERVRGEFAGESGVKAEDDFWDGVGVVTEVRTRERRSGRKPKKN